MDPFSLTLASGYLLDLALGDPQWAFHPVRLLGKGIERGEGWIRARFKSEEAGGLLLVLAVAGGTWAGTLWLSAFARGVSPGFGWLTEVLLLYFCFSTKDLAAESWPVYRSLKAGDLPQARKKVAMIVGRDTAELDEPEVVRAAVETIAESAMDGVVAPLFYAALGGAPLACLYKAVNTLDSMIGYRSARYLRFGRAAARVDSWMNRVPAVATSCLLALAGQMTRRSGGKALAALRRDGWPTRENSLLTEAAIAGALGVRLGGVNVYQGKPSPVPSLGNPERPLEAERIAEAIRLMFLCSFMAFLGALVIRRLVS